MQQARKPFPVQPGDGTISASLINDLVSGVESLRRVVGPGLHDAGNFALEETEPDLFVAKLTEVEWIEESGAGSGSGSGGLCQGWTYSWVEMAPAACGIGYAVKVGGRSGTKLLNAAYPLNGQLVGINSLVWMREKSFTGRSDLPIAMVYEFLDDPTGQAQSGDGSGGSGNYIDVVTEVCLIAESGSSGSGLSQL